MNKWDLTLEGGKFPNKAMKFGNTKVKELE